MESQLKMCFASNLVLRNCRKIILIFWRVPETAHAELCRETANDIVSSAHWFQALHVDAFKVVVGNFDFGFVDIGVVIALHDEPVAGFRGSNKADGLLYIQERLRCTMLGDIAEYPVFNLVPFAAPRRELGDLNLKSCPFCEFPQFFLPKSEP